MADRAAGLTIKSLWCTVHIIPILCREEDWAGLVYTIFPFLCRDEDWVSLVYAIFSVQCRDEYWVAVVYTIFSFLFREEDWWDRCTPYFLSYFGRRTG